MTPDDKLAGGGVEICSALRAVGHVQAEEVAATPRVKRGMAPHNQVGALAVFCFFVIAA